MLVGDLRTENRVTYYTTKAMLVKDLRPLVGDGLDIIRQNYS